MFSKIYDREIKKGDNWYNVDLYQVNSTNYLLTCRETGEFATFHVNGGAWAAINIAETMSNLPFLSYYRDEVEVIKEENLVKDYLFYALDGIRTGFLPEYPLENSYCFM